MSEKENFKPSPEIPDDQEKTINPISKEYHYHHQEIHEMEPGIQDLFEQIRDSIEKDEYSWIMSEETSGHIPSLIFKKLIDTIHQDNSPNYSIPLFFKSKPSHTDEFNGDLTQISDFLNGREKIGKPINLDKRCLYVTDTIDSGKTLLANLKKSVRDGIKNIDVIVLHDVHRPENETSRQKLFDFLSEHKITCFTTPNGSTTFFKKNKLSGIDSFIGAAIIRPGEKDYPFTENYGTTKENARLSINQTREDIKTLAEEILSERSNRSKK